MKLKTLIRGMPYLFQVISHMKTGSPFGFSFNLADRCPINCQCYWKAMARVKELPDDEVISFFERKRDDGFLLATILGGEPYVRPELLKKVTGILPATWVITSGTTPLLRLNGTTHFVSIDGADAKTHDLIRGSVGLYDRVARNISKARAGGNFPITIHAVLNSLNYLQIERILQTWQDNKLVDHVVFSTMTPINGLSEELALSFDRCKEIVHTLHTAKRRFGNFLALSDEMIDRLDPEITSTQIPELCPTSQLVPSFDASGNRISKCILGPGADCSRCGCVITAMFEPFIRFDIPTWRVIGRLYTPKA